MDLASSDEGKALVVLSKEQLKEEIRLDLLIAMLEIPLYERATKVMFYDVLVSLCFSRNYLYFFTSNILTGHVFGLGDGIKKFTGPADDSDDE